MRETNFIKQNEEKWREFERVMELENKDPDKLNDLFVQITDDLSYSRTFYPNRSVRVYLNGLAQRIFFKLYTNKRSRARRLLTFWTDELPALVYESRPAFRLSFFAFVIACLIGAVSSAMDEQFAAVILSEDYVEMTMENINSGDPMAVYKQKGAFGMSLGITFNNLWVAFLTFVLGAFFTIGSIAILIKNGIMLGAFQYFFIEKGLFWESFLTIWIHGTLEISAIIIAGAAGITMGRGLVFPGTYSRSQAFQRSARRGIKLMIGISPIIVMAGFIEGYLTRHTDTSPLVRGAFIAVCLLFVLGYFVWYPRYKARRADAKRFTDTGINPSRTQFVIWNKVKSSGEILSDIFVLYKRYLSTMVWTAAMASLLFCVFAFLPGDTDFSARFLFPMATSDLIRSKQLFFVNANVPYLWLANSLIWGGMALVVFRLLWQEEEPDLSFNRKRWLMGAINVILPMLCLHLVLLTNDWYTIFLAFGLFPVVCLWAYASLREQLLLPQALGGAFSLIKEGLGTSFGLYSIVLTLGFLFSMMGDTALANLFLDLVTWVVHFEEPEMSQFSTVVLTYASTFLLHLVLAMVFWGGGLLYYSLKEARDATSLKKSINNIGVSNRIQGLDKE
jgi:uncharacterized membrane protein SpoIIM required for sporulation